MCWGGGGVGGAGGWGGLAGVLLEIRMRRKNTTQARSVSFKHSRSVPNPPPLLARLERAASDIESERSGLFVFNSTSLLEAMVARIQTV